MERKDHNSESLKHTVLSDAYEYADSQAGRSFTEETVDVVVKQEYSTDSEIPEENCHFPQPIESKFLLFILKYLS